MILLPIQVSPARRLWVDISFRYEKYLYAHSTEDLARYILKYGHVDGIYEDEQIAHDVRRTAEAMVRDGVPRRQVIEEVSTLYGIPVVCVEEVLADLEAIPV